MMKQTKQEHLKPYTTASSTLKFELVVESIALSSMSDRGPRYDRLFV